MNLINRFLWHYWWGQSQYLQQRLDELDAEKNNMREDRRKVRARLMKADARVITYAQIGGCEMRDLYRGDGGRLSSYDEGWNDGVEAAVKALSAEVEALRAALQSCLNGIEVIAEQFESAGVPCETYQRAGEQARDVLRKIEVKS